MKFSTSVDIGLPAEALFALIADIEAHERAALKRGAVLRRVVPPGAGAGGAAGPDAGPRAGPPAGQGLVWTGTVPVRGRRRPVTFRTETWTPPEAVLVTGESPNFVFRFELDLLALSRARTRLRVALEVRPLTLTGRLIIQSARLGKGRLDRRFSARVDAFAAAAEATAARGAASG